MADETKTQIPKPTRQRGPMGRMGGMRRGEKAKDFKGTMRQLLGYIGQHKIAVFTAVAFAVCSVIFNIVGPKVLGQVTTKLFEGLVAKVNGTGDVDFNWIAKTLGFLLCLYLASSICSLIQGWLMTGVTQKICYRMRKEIAAKIAVVPMSYFNGHSKGDVLSRITNDVSTLQQALANSLPSMISAAAQFLGCLVMMFVTEWRMALAAIAVTALGFLIMATVMLRSQKYFTARQENLSTLNGYIEEMYSGHDVVRLSRANEQVKETFGGMNAVLYDAEWRSQFLSGIMQPLMTIIGNLGYVAVCVLGSALAMSGEISFGVIVAFILYVRLFTSPLSTLAQGMTQMQTAAAAGDHVFDFLHEKELPDETGKRPELSPVQGEVEFEHVRFSYPNHPDKIIIKDFSAKVQPGQRQVKRVIAEMGGKNATIVDDDADLDEAVSQVVYSAFGFQGQKCSACSRVIVLDAIYDTFVQRLALAAQSLRIGPAENPENFLGPLADASLQKNVLEYIEIAEAEGKTLVKRSDLPDKGAYVPLLIVEDVMPEHRIAQEEVFGPVLAVMRAKDFDEALELALSTRFALTGAVFSRSPENLAKAREKFRVGNLYLNKGSTGAMVGRQPFGGFNMSGVGSKTGGPDYLLQFMDPRCVTENTIRRGFTPIAEDDDWV